MDAASPGNDAATADSMYASVPPYAGSQANGNGDGHPATLD